MKKVFSSTKTYIANEQLIEAVNSSIILEKPFAYLKVSQVLAKLSWLKKLLKTLTQI